MGSWRRRWTVGGAAVTALRCDDGWAVIVTDGPIVVHWSGPYDDREHATEWARRQARWIYVQSRAGRDWAKHLTAHLEEYV